MEEWRDIPGFEGLYQVSISTKEGKCRSLNLYSHKEPKLLNNTPHKSNDRIKWILRKDGKPICNQAAVWIAMTYPEMVQNEYFEGAEICHEDNDPMNNHPSNLRWGTHKYNMNNPLTRKDISEGHKGKHREGKWVIQLSLNNEILHFYPSARQAQRETGIDNSSIGKCCNGKLKSAGGFTWKYSD